jgi:hypothetical protein
MNYKKGMDSKWVFETMRLNLSRKYNENNEFKMYVMVMWKQKLKNKLHSNEEFQIKMHQTFPNTRNLDFYK